MEDWNWQCSIHYPHFFFFFNLTQAQSTVSRFLWCDISGISRNFCVLQDRALRATPLDGSGILAKLYNSLWSHFKWLAPPIINEISLWRISFWEESEQEHSVKGVGKMSDRWSWWEYFWWDFKNKTLRFTNDLLLQKANSADISEEFSLFFVKLFIYFRERARARGRGGTEEEGES